MARIDFLVYLLLVTQLLFCNYGMAQTASTLSPSARVSAQSWQILQEIVSEVGARPAGSSQERQLLYDFTNRYWSQIEGVPVNSQPVTFSVSGIEKRSVNIWITFPGRSGEHLVIGAHADSAGEDEGSQGVTDNGIAVALLLALGQQLGTMELRDSVTLVLFGAEEVGLFGSQAFTAALKADSRFLTGAPFPTAMINLDTIAGGDHLYVHSPTQKTYKRCDKDDRYNSSASVRDSLLSVASANSLPFNLHPAFPGFPAGETGEWSDHAPFACAGIPVAYIETTNFSIKGRDGYDGYSQALHPSLWNCLDHSEKTACHPAQEQRWGQIWHTNADRLDRLNQLYPERLFTQLDVVSKLLIDFLTTDK